MDLCILRPFCFPWEMENIFTEFGENYKKVLLFLGYIGFFLLSDAFYMGLI